MYTILKFCLSSFSMQLIKFLCNGSLHTYTYEKFLLLNLFFFPSRILHFSCLCLQRFIVDVWLSLAQVLTLTFNRYLGDLADLIFITVYCGSEVAVLDQSSKCAVLIIESIANLFFFFTWESLFSNFIYILALWAAAKSIGKKSWDCFCPFSQYCFRSSSWNIPEAELAEFCQQGNVSQSLVFNSFALGSLQLTRCQLKKQEERQRNLSVSLVGVRSDINY